MLEVKQLKTHNLPECFVGARSTSLHFACMKIPPRWREVVVNGMKSGAIVSKM